MTRTPPNTSNRRSEHGVTIVEILITITLIALAGTAVSLGFGAVSGARIKAASMQVVAATRFAYNRAVTEGTTVRIVFSGDGHSFNIEEAHGGVTLSREGEKDAVDPWVQAEQRLASDTGTTSTEDDGDTLPDSLFGPLETRDGKPIKKYTGVKLEGSSRFQRLQTPHKPDGTRQIHFFPHGQTEQAVVQLTDDTGQVYSIKVHPLTGRASVHRGEHNITDFVDEQRELRR